MSLSGMKKKSLSSKISSSVSILIAGLMDEAHERHFLSSAAGYDFICLDELVSPLLLLNNYPDRMQDRDDTRTVVVTVCVRSDPTLLLSRHSFLVSTGEGTDQNDGDIRRIFGGKKGRQRQGEAETEQ